MSKHHRRRGARDSRVPGSHLSNESQADTDAALSSNDELEVHRSETNFNRHERLQRILLDELRSVLRDEASDPALQGVLLLAMDLSVDGGHARVAYALEAEADGQRALALAAREGLARATGFLRARLASQLDLKRLPKLTFTFVGVQAPGTGGDACLE